jgi:hypothetical protein
MPSHVTLIISDNRFQDVKFLNAPVLLHMHDIRPKLD